MLAGRLANSKKSDFANQMCVSVCATVWLVVVNLLLGKPKTRPGNIGQLQCPTSWDQLGLVGQAWTQLLSSWAGYFTVVAHSTAKPCCLAWLVGFSLGPVATFVTILWVCCLLLLATWLLST